MLSSPKTILDGLISQSTTLTMFRSAARKVSHSLLKAQKFSFSTTAAANADFTHAVSSPPSPPIDPASESRGFQRRTNSIARHDALQSNHRPVINLVTG